MRAIKREMERHGNACDLNHIDVSAVTDFSELFMGSPFNGDVSRWNVSNGRDFKQMFYGAAFNGDITGWAIHPEAVVLSMYSLKQTRVDAQPSIFHWRIAQIDIDNVSPALGQHYTKHVDLARAIMSDPLERAYWMQEQWCLARSRQQAGPQETYAVDGTVFEALP